MNLEIINSIVTFVVGLIALGVYWLTKKSEKQAAATIVVMDIRHAEQVVLSILEKGSVDRFMKNILHENNWAKYKHLFATNFSQDDFAAFNRFFEACVEISAARKRMVDVFYENINTKVELTHQKIFAIEDLLLADGQVKKEKIIKEINTEEAVFDPNEPKMIVLRNLQLIGRLSNTVAFEKLKKIAGIRT